MSTASREFYGVRCDFPDCGDIFEGSEYSYWDDPSYAADEARDMGWLIDFDGRDFCTAHVVSIEDEHNDPDDDDWGLLRPLEDTIGNRLRVAMDRVVTRAHQRLDAVDRRLRDDLHDRYGGLAARTDRALVDIHERTCRSFKPDITAQELFDLRRPA